MLPKLKEIKKKHHGMETLKEEKAIKVRVHKKKHHKVKIKARKNPQK